MILKGGNSYDSGGIEEPCVDDRGFAGIIVVHEQGFGTADLH
jgi:hypothetical protein